MYKLKDAMKIVYDLIYDKAKIPHRLSYPIFKNNQGEWFIIFFNYTYTAEQLRLGMFPKPDVKVSLNISKEDLSAWDKIYGPHLKEDDLDEDGNVKLYPMEPSYKEYIDDSKGVLNSLAELMFQTIRQGKYNPEIYGAYLTLLREGCSGEVWEFYEDLIN